MKTCVKWATKVLPSVVVQICLHSIQANISLMVKCFTKVGATIPLPANVQKVCCRARGDGGLDRNAACTTLFMDFVVEPI